MIPVSTDAPLYHWPFATVATIVLNVLLYFVFCTNPDKVTAITPDGRSMDLAQVELELDQFETEEEAQTFLDSLEIRQGGMLQVLSVEFGKFKPWQWVTNNFMHASLGHLIGNMIFLWAFGMVVEGKVGPFGYALIYLGIGTLYGAILQTCSLVVGWEGIALGASAVIFGMLALCVAWAPANEFTIFMRFTTFDISILLYGALFICKELGFWALQGFKMSSELLHIIGFAVAMPIGLWMIRAGKVDCEGWDIFSYLAGRTGEESSVGKAKIQERALVATQKQKALSANQLAEEAANQAEANRRLQDQVQHAIDGGDIELAINIQTRISKANPTLHWRQKDLQRVIQSLLKTQKYAQAESLIEKHIELFEHSRFQMEVVLMKIWMNQRQPKKALDYLRGINTVFLEPAEAAQIKQLVAAAEKQLAKGTIDK